MAAYITAFRDLYNRVENCPLPTIAKVDGAAHGGGSELAMACDIWVASLAVGIKQAEINLGLILCLTGRELTAGEAHDYGVFNYVADCEQLDDVVRDRAAEIATKSPHALAKTKEALTKTDGHDVQEAIEIRHLMNQQCYLHPNFVETI